MKLYQDIKFIGKKGRPFFYTNFVSTIDGKIQVVSSPKAYWPIGSKEDYETLIELRAHADVLIHGKNTAMWIRTLDNLEKESFRKRRKQLGKKKDIVYVVISNNPTSEIAQYLNSKKNVVKTLLATSEKAKAGEKISKATNTLRLGREELNLRSLASYFKKNNLKNILVEGGPTLLGSFLKEDLIDEVFLTIAPKIFGNTEKDAITMVEGVLFAPDKVKKLKLLSSKVLGDEICLRYKIEQK